MALLRDGTRIYGNGTVDDTLIINGQVAATSNTTGTLKVDGGIGVTGNIFSTGNLHVVNGNLGNLGYANYLSGTLTTAAQPNITSVGTLSSLSVTGNITAGNANLGNAARANFFIGDGSLLTNVTFTGTVSNANFANTALTVTSSSQPNITEVGNLTTLTVVGNITISGDSNLGNSVSANYFIGNGGFLTYIDGANVFNAVANANYAAYAGNVVASSQPNITNVGNLSSLVVEGNLSAGNLSTSGTLSAGDSTITGNLTVTGNFEYVNVTTLNIKDPIIELGGNPNGTALASNDGKDRGQLLHYFVGGGTGPVDAFMGWDASNSEFAFGSNVSVSSEVTTFNTFGNVRAGYFIGNGSQLTGISSANTANTVVASAQPNITSVGTLVNLTVSGNVEFSGANVSLGNVSNLHITGGTANYVLKTDGTGNVSWVDVTSVGAGTGSGNANVAGSNTQIQYNNGTNLGASANLTFDYATNTLSVTSATITANISAGNANLGNLATANYFSGNGSLLTGVAAASANTAAAVANGTSNVNIPVANGNINLSAVGNANVVVITGTGVNIAGTTNITGNLTAGNANLGNFITANYFSGNGRGLTGVTAESSTTVANGNSNVNIPAANGNVIISSAGNANIVIITGTGVNVAGTLDVTGNLHSGNANLGNIAVANYFSGSGNLLSNIQGGNVSGAVANANYSVYAGSIITGSQPNVTEVGNLLNLTVLGNINLGNGLNLTSSSLAGYGGGFGNIGQILTAMGDNTVSWTNKFFVGNVPPQASSILPNYGDCWFYIDEDLDPPASRLYMWVTDGTSDFYYDFLPPTF